MAQVGVIFSALRKLCINVGGNSIVGVFHSVRGAEKINSIFGKRLQFEMFIFV